MVHKNTGQDVVYRCTSPTLAGRLLYKHFKGSFLTLPPEIPGKRTKVYWDFPESLPLLETVAAYYREDLKKNPPLNVRKRIEILRRRC